MWAEGSWLDARRWPLREAGGLADEGKRVAGLGVVNGPLAEGGPCGAAGEARPGGDAGLHGAGPTEESPREAGSTREAKADLGLTGPLVWSIWASVSIEELFSFLAWVPVESDESEQYHKLEGSIVFKIYEFTKVFISYHSSSLFGSPFGIGIVPSINPNFFFERKAKRMAFAHST
ncbi:hypothetical protein M9H77_30126 [Catharanthus roseus]|uniref:Uncharacterized protein n=1 Tax=Catharanthus roseus TaxID=4058 RepID=A0ACB9ZX72_CATRO|nr:hypothetical protein M9H77_30126 [Catharanthus roseus]